MKHVYTLLEQEIKRYQKSIETYSALLKATGSEEFQSALLRDEEYRNQFQRAYDILLSNEPDVQASVASKVDSSNQDDKQNK